MHKSAVLFSSLWIVAATALPASSVDTEALAYAQRQQLDFRQGNLAAAKPLVERLESAVAKSPDNAQLWEALGGAYMSFQGSMYAGPLDMPALIAAGEHGRDAYARALALEPKRPLARAGHGMATMVVSQLKGDGPGVMAGVEEMNAAVLDSPKSPAVRLTRGFTIIHLPPDMRDNEAVISDLRFILDAAPGGRPEDVVHVLLGDVLVETGKPELARSEYQQVTGASAFAAEQVKLRLAELSKGSVSHESIAAVRMGTGTRCAMCHAPGTDN